MSVQFDRKVRVIVSKPGGAEGTQIGDGFRIAFEVAKKDGSSSNEAKIKVWGLSKPTIELIRQRNAVIQLYAGYGDVVPLIYKGIVTRVSVDFTNGEVICNIESKKNFLSIPRASGPTAQERAAAQRLFRLGQNYIARVFTEQTPILDGLRVVVDDVKTILGDYASEVVADLQKVPSGPARAPRGVALSGTPEQVLTGYTAANNLDWWMEDGVIRVVPKGDASRETAFVLGPDSGLIGSPKPKLAGKNQKGATGIDVICLLNGELRVRRAVQIVGTRALTGWYLIRKVSHKGDSGWDTEYYTHLEVTPIKARPVGASGRAAQPKALRQFLDATGAQIQQGATAIIAAITPTWPSYAAAKAEVTTWFAAPAFRDQVVNLYKRPDGQWAVASPTTSAASIKTGTPPIFPIRRPA